MTEIHNHDVEDLAPEEWQVREKERQSSRLETLSNELESDAHVDPISGLKKISETRK